MSYSLKQITPPIESPVTLDEAKTHVSVASSISYHDDQLTRLIRAATEQVQIFSGRQILTATYRMSIDRFPDDADDPIYLPMPPLRSVSSITYLDAAGATQTLATTVYMVQTDHEPGQIILRSGQSWPSTLIEQGAVTITYVAGEADTAGELGDGAELVKQAILLLVQAYWLRDFGQPFDRLMVAVDRIIEGHRCGDDFLRYGEE